MANLEKRLEIEQEAVASNNQIGDYSVSIISFTEMSKTFEGEKNGEKFFIKLVSQLNTNYAHLKEEFHKVQEFSAHSDRVPKPVESFCYKGEFGIEYLAIVEEMLDGESLRKHVNSKGPVISSDVKYMAVEILKVLKDMHNHKLYHLDLKPENMMICRDGIKIVDFGSSIVLKSSITKTVTSMANTFDFSDPEYFGYRGKLRPEDSQRMDMYGFAATIYFLLAGKNPEPRVKEYFVDLAKLLDEIKTDKNSELVDLLKEVVKKESKGNYNYDSLISRLEKNEIAPAPVVKNEAIAINPSLENTLSLLFDDEMIMPKGYSSEVVKWSKMNKEDLISEIGKSHEYITINEANIPVGVCFAGVLEAVVGGAISDFPFPELGFLTMVGALITGIIGVPLQIISSIPSIQDYLGIYKIPRKKRKLLNKFRKDLDKNIDREIKKLDGFSYEKDYIQAISIKQGNIYYIETEPTIYGKSYYGGSPLPFSVEIDFNGKIVGPSYNKDSNLQVRLNKFIEENKKDIQNEMRKYTAERESDTNTRVIKISDAVRNESLGEILANPPKCPQNFIDKY